MRVTHIAPTAFGPGGLFGGGERYPFELARAMSQMTPTRLVTFGDQEDVRRHADLEVVTLRKIASFRGHPAHPVARGLRDHIANVDVVHTHHMRSAPSRIAALLAQGSSRTLAVTDHGLGGGGWFGVLPRLFDAFLPVSEFSAATLNVPKEKTHVVYGGCDVQRFAPGDDVRHGVLYVGRITPHKGIDRLIRALPHDVSLTVAGTSGHDPEMPEAAYPDLLRRVAIGKEVSFIGRVDEIELPRLYRRAQIYVLPSVETTCYGKRIAISELLGLSLLEAMASGTPVIASRVGGLPEVVRHGETGLLVPPGDEVALREAINELTHDRAKARRMGEAGRELVAETFTWERCAERCIAAYGAAA